MDPMILCLFSTLPGSFILGGVWSYAAWAAHLKAWQIVAGHTGMTLSRGKPLSQRPQLFGTYRGWHVMVWSETQHFGGLHGDIFIPFMKITVAVPNPRQLRFRLVDHLLSSINIPFLGLRDLDVGDRRFDAKFAVTGNPAADVIALFASRDMLRHDLNKLRAFGFAVQLRGNQLLYSRIGIERSPDKLQAMLDSLVDLAAAIGGAALVPGENDHLYANEDAQADVVE